MLRLPIEYEIVVAESSPSPLEVTASTRPAIPAGPPTEFGGTDRWWSPEHLFVSSAATCFAATFFALLRKANLHVAAFQCRAQGVLARTDSGMAFTSIHLTVHGRALGDEIVRIRDVVESAKTHCLVANSMRCPVTIAAEFRPS